MSFILAEKELIMKTRPLFSGIYSTSHEFRRLPPGYSMAPNACKPIPYFFSSESSARYLLSFFPESTPFLYQQAADKHLPGSRQILITDGQIGIIILADLDHPAIMTGKRLKAKKKFVNSQNIFLFDAGSGLVFPIATITEQSLASAFTVTGLRFFRLFRYEFLMKARMQAQLNCVSFSHISAMRLRSLLT
ncbi:MAG: hypothetical protein LLG09_03470 [Negativicutes bacterium]|nr:hypothetical protein [Negativicutes bacterium]